MSSGLLPVGLGLLGLLFRKVWFILGAIELQGWLGTCQRFHANYCS